MAQGYMQDSWHTKSNPMDSQSLFCASDVLSISRVFDQINWSSLNIHISFSLVANKKWSTCEHEGISQRPGVTYSATK